MRVKFTLPTVFVLITGTSAVAQNNDFLIVPGERVGPITRDASEDSLRAIYGNDRVESVLVPVGEGFVCKGSRILFDDGEFLDVTWLDTKTKAVPDSIYVKGKGWKTNNGIGLGMSLQEIEEINGKPFRLSGYGWDYGGTITSWESGKLEGYLRKIWLRLTPDKDINQLTSENEAKQVRGDRAVPSDHPVMRKLNPRLTYLAVDLNPENYCKEFDP